MRKRDAVCGLLTVLAVVFYMLACGSRPAWSPDSKRVAFGFLDSEAKVSGLALYDLQDREVKTIYQSEEVVLFQPVWMGKQEGVITLAAGEDILEIIQVDLLTGESKVLKSISAKAAMAALMVPPILVSERYLLFSAQTSEDKDSDLELHRFDLQTGELQAIPDSAGHYIFQVGKKSFYRTAVEDGVKIGEFDTDTLKFRELFILSEQSDQVLGHLEMSEPKAGPMGFGLGAKKNGSEFVVAYRGLEVNVPIPSGNTPNGQPDILPEGQLHILNVNRKGLIVKKLHVPCYGTAVPGDNIIYGPKGKSLWIPLVSPTKRKRDDKSGECKISLVEVHLKEQTSKVIVEAVAGEEAGIAMQLSISPNGKWLAAQVLVSKDNPESVLYLVDLTDPERNVTEVGPPREEPAEETPITEQAGNE